MVTAKEYLNKIKDLDELIEAHMGDLRRIRSQAYTLPSPGFNERHSSGRPSSAPFEKNVIHICDVEAQINDEIEELVALRVDISQRISTLENTQEKLVLQYRYVNSMSWKEVSARMSISERKAQRIHGSALQHFPVPEDEE